MNENETACIIEAIDAQAVAMFPPRPDAFVTLLHSDSFVPGAQTMLYSLRKSLSLQQTYPPEVVVLVTPNVSKSIQKQLCPALCTRVLPVEEWMPPTNSINNKLAKKRSWKRILDNDCPGWTKLHIFGLQQYDTIVYIDTDCLILKDISNLLELNKIYTESEALIAAAPDILPPDHFNSGVMVIRPSTAIYQKMHQQASLLTTFDGSDTGFLNAFFSNWYTEFPPNARLSIGYNAQQAMFDLTRDSKDGQSSFWDVQIASDLYIVHYSNAEKPWETSGLSSSSSTSSCPLQELWKSWYNKSKNYLTRQRKLEAQQSPPHGQKSTGKAVSAPPPPSVPRNHPQQIHKLISRRFKELRAQGLSAREAMQQAQSEFQVPESEDVDAGTKVAAMFGMR